ncbi:MAG: SIS domain-containing protein [Deltaproteobacteria bacterium]|nr:SIS domain-containing protein [Deltaproteobacteria bacterium]
MCGIACFLGNNRWRESSELTWVEDLRSDLAGASSDPDDLTRLTSSVEGLANRFKDLMCFALHLNMLTDPRTSESIENIAGYVLSLRDRTSEMIKRGESSHGLESLHEKLEDYLWQLDREVIQNVTRTRSLISEGLGGEPTRSQHYLAWVIEQVIESIDKLEVRGRDSAGLAVLCVLPSGTRPEDRLDEFERAELDRRRSIRNALSGFVLTGMLPDGRRICRFVYKVANLVGRLGDNGNALRAAIRDDRLLWKLCAELESANLIAHTRWASNGIISVPNCHPVDGRVIRRTPSKDGGNDDVMFVLNGDVDNYGALVDTVVIPNGASIDPSISTDAKILPVLFNLDGAERESAGDRFGHVMQRCVGSLAVAMQHPKQPSSLYLAQKGSGQSLYVGKVLDGWLVASEPYGLAARCRRSYPIATVEQGGVSVILSEAPSSGEEDDVELSGRFLAGGGSFHLKPETIEVFSRDIFRKHFDYYIEKEIHEAPESVLKTLHGKYRKSNGRVEFLLGNFGNCHALLRRFQSPDLPPIRRIVVAGQGTASIASMGIAFLIRRALEPRGIVVESTKASELFGFLADRRLEDTVLIAVSQSGTTNDTNRVVDLARERGAWVHAIVNRRNSPLVRKSNSYMYTSNGRDVEMSVASTKAYYSQVAAGKLMALWLAKELEVIGDEDLFSELTELENLPDKIAEVLKKQESIARYAGQYGPFNRYWAVVGNGANRIAAEEIRIKLSELCYKSIPCDVTEDKKHIDLSTEPFTIVVANDLSEMVVQDTVKEVTIFKAHNGRPMVFCAAGEHRFDGIAECTTKLPLIGGGLAFVLATVAGHLWGIEAAKEIDRRADCFRNIRHQLARVIEHTADWDPDDLLRRLEEGLSMIENGQMDSALPARHVAALARYILRLKDQPRDMEPDQGQLMEALSILNNLIDESTRPIDTIRHQAKTVTVGISRPQLEISPLLLDSFQLLGVLPDHLMPHDRHLLEALSPVISGVEGGLLYQVLDPIETRADSPPPRIRAVAGTGSSKVEESRYVTPQHAKGSKRRVLRTSKSDWSAGPQGTQTMIVLPVFMESDLVCSHEALLHLVFITQASLQQKIAILAQLGQKYQDLIDQKEELSVAKEIDEILADASPRDLIFKSVDALLKK